MRVATVERPWLLLGFFLLVTLTVYGNTFFNQWTYDDVPVILQNADVRSLDAFLQNTVPGRPLRELSFMVDHALFGDSPAGYRLQQLAWHGVNGFLLCLLLVWLGVELPYALAGALFFLVHPLQAESVANLAHRKELLALFFSLGSTLLYLRATAAEGWRQWLLAGGAVIAYLGAMLSNETAVALSVALVIMEWLVVSREQRLLLRRPLGLAVAAATLAAIAVWRYRWVFSPQQLYTVYSKNGFAGASDYLPLFMASLGSFGFYLGKILLPVRLAPEYVFRLSADMVQPLAWVGAALLAGVAATVVVLRRRMPLVALGAGWFLAFWLPVSNLVPVAYLVADRYMYLCLPGVGIAVAAVLQRWPQRWLMGTCGAVLLALALATVVQNGHWRNEHTLWRHAVRVNAGSTWVQGAAAKSYLATGELESARTHAVEALRLSSFNVEAHLTLARIEERLGNFAEALKQYQLFVALGQVDFPAEVVRVQASIPLLKERLDVLQRQGRP